MVTHEGWAETSIVDAVWSIGKDGRWRNSAEFARILSRKREDVAAALELLVTYGFAESQGNGDKRFRTMSKSLSPSEAAGLLTSRL